MTKWQPIEMAPRDGTVVRARGFDYGDPSRKRHYVNAVYHKNGWYNPAEEHEALYYLTDWHPLTGAVEPEVTSP